MADLPRNPVVTDAELDQLLTAALKNANSSSLEDLGKVANAAKAITEARKASVDAQNSRAQIKLEGLKSLATFLVPVVSLLTVVFTVYIQYLQLEETHRQNEATQWREFLSSTKGSSENIQSDPTFSPRLRSFFSSPLLGSQAISISKRMMGGIANASGFRELFGVTFGEVNSRNADDVAEVARSLYANISSTETSCFVFFDSLEDDIRQKLSPVPDYSLGVCDPTMPEKKIKSAGLSTDDQKRLYDLRRVAANLTEQNWFLVQQIAGFLRTNFKVGSKASSANPFSLKGVDFLRVDLSDVDFTGFDLTDTILDSVTLDGAQLTPRAFGAALDLRYSAWWTAGSIEPRLLDYLITNQYPYYIATEFYPSGAVEEPEYRKQIERLCKPRRATCEPQSVIFGKRADRAN